MKLIRRAFYIEEGEDNRADAIAEVVPASKSEIINLALVKGLAQIQGMQIREIVSEINERRLRLVEDGSIKAPSAKRGS